MAAPEKCSGCDLCGMYCPDHLRSALCTVTPKACQMVREVERASAGKAWVIPVSHAGGGVHKPEATLEDYGGSIMSEMPVRVTPVYHVIGPQPECALSDWLPNVEQVIAALRFALEEDSLG